MSARTDARIKARFRAVVVCAILCILCAGAAGAAFCWNGGAEADLREEVLQLNEVRQHLANEANGPNEANSPAASSSRDQGGAADDALVQAQEALRHAASERNRSAWWALLLMTCVALAAVAGVAAYLRRSIVAPFLRLDAFADEVARGNLDAPLAYERANPFGSFAWAFDHMRVQLAQARDERARADEAYKTALASLSHDLRTPLAALRAHAEALELGLARTPEECVAYERLIVEKCDEASGLVEDLLSHALADMGRIQVELKVQPVAPVVRACTEGFASALPITCMRLDEAACAVDAKRLRQALDNLLANAAKYAPGAPVEVRGVRGAGAYRIEVRDFGPGIPSEDMPFAQKRFYRGANAGEAPGAGLGLYIAGHLAERMDGRLILENAEPGLRAVIEVPCSLMTP